MNSPGLLQPLGCHQRHRDRIHNKLCEFLPTQEAQKIATHIYDLSLEVDEDLDRILKDPLVRRLYEYDGRFFTLRGTGLFHAAFDGLHILEWLRNSMLETFFRGREKSVAIRWLLQELGRHAWLAKVRRMNCEEFGTLNLVSQEALNAIIQDVRERRGQLAEGSPPLSAEEQVFFQFFEKQMRDFAGASQ